jgi:hypothetical protein
MAIPFKRSLAKIQTPGLLSDAPLFVDVSSEIFLSVEEKTVGGVDRFIQFIPQFIPQFIS